MTVQQIIKETETLTPNEQQNLLFYFLYSTLKDEKQKEFFKLINKKEVNKKIKPKFTFGMMKGLVKYMLADFDEPLNEFKEYM